MVGMPRPLLWLPRAAECAVLGLFAGGCGGDPTATSIQSSAPEPGAEDGSPLSYQPCPTGQRVGSFVIELTDEYTSVGGKVFDAVAPRDVPVEVRSDGDCTLFTTPVLQCNPGCDPSTQVCGAGNQCLPQPEARDLGKVTVSGLLVPLQLEPNRVTKAYTNPASAQLPQPGFEPGARLRLSSSGGDYMPIDLRGWGVSLLQGVSNPIAVQAGRDVPVRWQPPPDGPGPARVHLNLNINHHGSSTNWIECDVPDTGMASVPAGLVDELLARGQSGFPTLTVTRRSASSAQIEPGCVELLVSSESVSDVELDNFQSCSRADECSPAESCGSEFFCL
jgi:hypothetical protein